MAWVHKNFIVGKKDGLDRKNDVGLNVLLFNHTLQKTLSSIEYDLIVPAELNKRRGGEGLRNICIKKI